MYTKCAKGALAQRKAALQRFVPEAKGDRCCQRNKPPLLFEAAQVSAAPASHYVRSHPDNGDRYCREGRQQWATQYLPRGEGWGPRSCRHRSPFPLSVPRQTGKWSWPWLGVSAWILGSPFWNKPSTSSTDRPLLPAGWLLALFSSLSTGSVLFFCKSSAKGPLRCFLRTVLLQNCSKTTFFLKSSSYSETIFITSLHTCKHSLHILCLRQLSIRTLKEILHAIFMPFHIIDLFLATSSATQPERCK